MSIKFRFVYLSFLVFFFSSMSALASEPVVIKNATAYTLRLKFSDSSVPGQILQPYSYATIYNYPEKGSSIYANLAVYSLTMPNVCSQKNEWAACCPIDYVKNKNIRSSVFNCALDGKTIVQRGQTVYIDSSNVNLFDSGSANKFCEFVLSCRTNDARK